MKTAGTSSAQVPVIDISPLVLDRGDKVSVATALGRPAETMASSM